MTVGDEEPDIKDLISNESLSEEQNQFNNLSKDDKLNRLNLLIQKSQVYSQIIADNILENSLNKKRKREEEKEKEAGLKTNEPPKKKGRSRNKKARNPKRDIMSMLSKNISDSTKSTKDVIEKSQVSHTQQQPKLVTGCTMKDYQLDGLEWLVTLYENGLNGILADEMGLGKTLECIAFLCFLIENNIKGPFLIVVPLSTLTNWHNEISIFAPKVKVLEYTGSKSERQNITLSEDYNIILTSYEISIRDFHRLNLINWKFLIVDEGHRLKNFNCMLIKFLRKLNVTNRLLLTGTPLQNNLDELWSLLNFILPDIFQDLELFQQWFNFDELTNLGNDVDDDQETKKVIQLNIQENLIKNLHTILKPFILRRLKKDVVKNLPPKKEYLIHIPLTKLQKSIYNYALNNKLSRSLIEIYLKEYINFNYSNLFRFPKDIELINNYLNERFADEKLEKRNNQTNFKEASSDDEFEVLEQYNKDDNDIEFNRLSKPNQKEAILDSLFSKISKDIKNLSLRNAVMQLRNICNSPYIYYEPFPMDDFNTKNNSKFMEILFKNSSKLQVLNQLCKSLLPNHKILIFSQFTRMLDLLHDWFNFKNIDVCRLDGSTAHVERDIEIKSFNEDPNKQVFLLSTRAGGLGINLTSADTVILFDSDWNPQVDLQAIDRVHRIGQLKPVKIFRFLIRNSIEEILVSKSSSKRFLEKLVIQMGEFKFNKFQQIIDNKDSGLKDLLEFSKNHKIFENDESIEEDLEYKFNDNKKCEELLTQEEINELTDRSDECYDSDNDKNFKNITVFESVNNFDR